jgi:glycosyltransferase involved in cell wall biosynthesis
VSGARRAWLAFPGELETPTGGYEYDRRLMAAAPAAGWEIAPLPLPAGFPAPSEDEVETALAALEGAPGPVVADGLALGALPAGRLSAGLRGRLVALCHHPLGLETGLERQVAARRLAAEAEVLGTVAQVLTTSEATAGVLAARLGVPRAKITVAPPGLERASAAARRGAPPVILGVGTISPRKGWDVLAGALALIADRDWRAVIAGADDREPEAAADLRARLAAAGLSGRVTRTGALPRDALDRLYAEADLFCLPSRYEGYGMVVAEAMARGLPVVASEAGAIPEAAGGAARLVPPDDAEALAGDLAGLLNDPGARDRMAAASLARAARLPGWEDTARRVAGVLEKVAEGRA